MDAEHAILVQYIQMSLKRVRAASASRGRGDAVRRRRAWPLACSLCARTHTCARGVAGRAADQEAEGQPLGGLLGKVKKEQRDDEPRPEIDELEQYLADSEEPDIEVDVLAWWKAKESKWPALAKMVKQYFAAPASSAGVERVFSAAGKMHSDLQKSARDSTLEHSLFAAFNTE